MLIHVRHILFYEAINVWTLKPGPVTITVLVVAAYDELFPMKTRLIPINHLIYKTCVHVYGPWTFSEQIWNPNNNWKIKFSLYWEALGMRF